MNTPSRQETRVETLFAFLFTAAAVFIVSGLFHGDISVLQAVGLTAAFYVACLLGGHAVGYGASRAKIATSEEYGAKVAKVQAEQSQAALRERLDPAGRVAYDALQRSIDRLENDEPPQDV